MRSSRGKNKRKIINKNKHVRGGVSDKFWTIKDKTYYEYKPNRYLIANGLEPISEGDSEVDEHEIIEPKVEEFDENNNDPPPPYESKNYYVKGGKNKTKGKPHKTKRHRKTKKRRNKCKYNI